MNLILWFFLGFLSLRYSEQSRQGKRNCDERKGCLQTKTFGGFEFGEYCLYSHPKATQENLNQEHAFFNLPMISISGDLLLRRPGPAPWGALWREGGVRQQVAIITMIRNVYSFSFSLKEFESNPRDLQSNSEGSARCSTLYLGLWTFSLVSYLSCSFVLGKTTKFFAIYSFVCWHGYFSPIGQPPPITDHFICTQIIGRRGRVIFWLLASCTKDAHKFKKQILNELIFSLKYKKAFVKFKFSQVDSSFAHPQVNHFFAVSHQEGEMALLNSPSDLTFPITIVFTSSPSNAKPTGTTGLSYTYRYIESVPLFKIR